MYNLFYVYIHVVICGETASLCVCVYAQLYISLSSETCKTLGWKSISVKDFTFFAEVSEVINYIVWDLQIPKEKEGRKRDFKKSVIARKTQQEGSRRPLPLWMWWVFSMKLEEESCLILTWYYAVAQCLQWAWSHGRLESRWRWDLESCSINCRWGEGSSTSATSVLLPLWETQ